MTIEEYDCRACGKMIKFPYKLNDGLCKNCFKLQQIMEAEAEAGRRKGIPEEKQGIRSLRM